MKVSIQKNSEKANKISKNVISEKQAQKVKGGNVIITDICDF